MRAHKVYSLDMPRLARCFLGSGVRGVPDGGRDCGLGWEVLGTNKV